MRLNPFEIRARVLHGWRERHGDGWRLNPFEIRARVLLNTIRKILRKALS